MDGNDGVLHHVLEVGEPVVQIFQVNPGPPSGAPYVDPVLRPLGAVHLVSVNTDLVSEELGQFSGIWRNTWCF